MRIFLVVVVKVVADVNVLMRIFLVVVVKVVVAVVAVLVWMLIFFAIWRLRTAPCTCETMSFYTHCRTAFAMVHSLDHADWFF
jgi:hypothetical protein